MTSEAEIPNWLNEDFVEKALQEVEKDSDIKVRKMNVRPVTSPGDNYASIMFRVTATYSKVNIFNEQVCTMSLIVKALPEVGQMREVMIRNDGFTIETQIILNVIPEFHRLLNSSSFETPVTLAAKCYYEVGKPNQKLVLEDLCQSGFKMTPRNIGLDLNHSKLAVSRLGLFHAASVALRRENPQSFGNYLVHPFIKTANHITNVIQNMFTNIAEKLEMWPEVPRKYSESLLHLGATATRRLEKAVERNDEVFNVLNHGDFWKNNLMFKYDEDGNLSDMRFVDFQFCYYGSPAIDLQYFFNSSPSSEVIIHHLDQLLECYYASLSKTLERLGCGDLCPSLNDIRVEMKKARFMGLAAAMFFLSLLFSDSDSVPNIDAMVDKESSGDSSKHMTENFINEIIKLLPIFEERGFLD